MKAISIRQPWAWLIINGYKDVENRDWPTHYRGRIWIHAGKNEAPKEEYIEALKLYEKLFPNEPTPWPPSISKGGIVGTVDIVDCVDKSDSPWFFGKFGFVLKNPMRSDFIPYRGRLGLFNVPDDQHFIKHSIGDG